MSSKVSALTALAGSAVDTAADKLCIYDASATLDRSITPAELAIATGSKLGTEQSLSGTGVSFSVPTWAKRIAVCIVGASLNQLSSSRAIEIDVTGPTSISGCVVNASGALASYSVGGPVLVVGSSAAASVWEALIQIVLVNPTSFTYSVSGVAATSNAATDVCRTAGRMSGGRISTLYVQTGLFSEFDAGFANVRFSR
jgi:hypothetical protein